MFMVKEGGSIGNVDDASLFSLIPEEKVHGENQDNNQNCASNMNTAINEVIESMIKKLVI
jgi:hypothetical protein